MNYQHKAQFLLPKSLDYSTMQKTNPFGKMDQYTILLQDTQYLYYLRYYYIQVNFAVQKNAGHTKKAGHMENFSIVTKTLYRAQRVKGISGLLFVLVLTYQLNSFISNYQKFLLYSVQKFLGIRDETSYFLDYFFFGQIYFNLTTTNILNNRYIFMYILFIYMFFYMSVLHEVSTFDMVFSQDMTHTIILDMYWYIRNTD